MAYTRGVGGAWAGEVMTRSMSDEQMLAKYGYDKEPWLWPDGSRTHSLFSENGVRATLSPRPKCIPSRDPWPYETNLGTRGDLATALRLRVEVRFASRREYRRPEVNPILSAFRDDWGLSIYGNTGLTAVWIAALTKRSAKRDFHATPEQVDSARVILERLARLQAVSA
jgi:hypothetical protein